jgi:hypothetical protein
MSLEEPQQESQEQLVETVVSQERFDDAIKNAIDLTGILRAIEGLGDEEKDYYTNQAGNMTKTDFIKGFWAVKDGKGSAEDFVRPIQDGKLRSAIERIFKQGK